MVAEVIGRPAGAFTQAIVIAAGANNGVRANDPVVTADGLVGVVTRVTSGTARIQLLTDEEAAASAIDLRTGATGIVRHARGTRETLVLDRVRKQDVVRRGNEIVTAGWRAGSLSSLYPKGIPIGRVTSVGQTDTDLFQQVQIDPYVDFGALNAVLVLVPTERGGRPRPTRCARSRLSSSPRYCRSSSSRRSSSRAARRTCSSSSSWRSGFSAARCRAPSLDSSAASWSTSSRSGRWVLRR